MIKVLFVCHGNICRSPMAEFLFKHIVQRQGVFDKFEIASAATSREEIGNPVHPGAASKLALMGISTEGKKAVQFTRDIIATIYNNGSEQSEKSSETDGRDLF
ncbi:MAG: hypothetical protein ACLU5E_10430 [Anaerovoracaceae bacterium]